MVTARTLDDDVSKPAPKDGEASPTVNAELKLELVEGQIVLGKFYVQEGKFDLALYQYKDAMEIANHWQQKAPGLVSWKEALANISDGFGDIDLSRGDFDRARDSYQSALGIRKVLAGRETSSGKRMLDLAVSEYKLASLEQLVGAEPKVVEDRSEAIKILIELRTQA